MKSSIQAQVKRQPLLGSRHRSHNRNLAFRKASGKALDAANEGCRSSKVWVYEGSQSQKAFTTLNLEAPRPKTQIPPMHKTFDFTQYLSISPSSRLFTHPAIHPSIYFFVCLSICLPIPLSLSLSLFFSISLSLIHILSMPGCLPACLPV